MNLLAVVVLWLLFFLRVASFILRYFTRVVATLTYTYTPFLFCLAQRLLSIIIHLQTLLTNIFFCGTGSASYVFAFTCFFLFPLFN